MRKSFVLTIVLLGPASLRGTASEGDLTTRILDRGRQPHGVVVGLAGNGPAILFFRVFTYFAVERVLVVPGHHVQDRAHVV